MTTIVANKTFSYRKELSKEETVTIGAIINEKEIIKLRKPIRAIWKNDGKYDFINYEKLDMYCYGESYGEALDNFNECLLSLKENYIDCDETELAKSGLLLKQELREFF